MKNVLLALTLSVGSTAFAQDDPPPPRVPAPSPPATAVPSLSPDQIQDMVNRAVDNSVERMAARMADRMAQLQQAGGPSSGQAAQPTLYASPQSAPQYVPVASPQQAVSYQPAQTSTVVVPVTMGQPVAAAAYVDVLVPPSLCRKAAAGIGERLVALGHPCTRRMQVAAPAAGCGTALVQATATVPAQQLVTQVVQQSYASPQAVQPVALPALPAQAPVAKGLPALPAKSAPGSFLHGLIK